MKLTELKRSIDEALKLHDDYDIRILTDEVNDIDCSIDSGRFYFNIYIDISKLRCEEYHIEDDMDMEHCSICAVYYSADEECPGCELKKFKESVKKALLF